MPSTNEIKNRIKSIGDTQKIVNAMYLIASTKMRHAEEELKNTRPYFDSLQSEIKRIFRTVKDVESHYFYPADGRRLAEGTYGLLIISADKGLAGAYNQNVINEALKLYKDHPDMKFFVVGEYGRRYFDRHRIPIEKSFLYTAQNPTMQRAREIAEILLNMFDEGKLTKIFLAYTDRKNSLNEVAVTIRLLPFHRRQFADTLLKEKEVKTPFEFFPSPEKVLDSVITSYVSGFIYSALVDSFCSEQTSRMRAMELARDNSKKIIDELSFQYNLARQDEITREITEIQASSRALKGK